MNYISNPYEQSDKEKDCSLINMDNFDKIRKGSVIDIESMYTILFLKNGDSQATGVWEFKDKNHRDAIYDAIKNRFTKSLL